MMFENQQREVEAMMASSTEFRALFLKHRELDKQVRDAEIGVLPIDDFTLVKMKNEKLWAKDKLTQMWTTRPS